MDCQKTQSMQNIKTKKRQKTVKLALALTAMLLLSMGAFAQEGLFSRRVSDEVYYGFNGAKENQGLFNQRNVETTGVINNQVFGQPVPLGSGVILLLGAGAGYAILKRKEDEK